MAKTKFINASHTEGYIYKHKLEAKVSGPASKNPGTPFINGSISVATDEDMLNIIDVNFIYVTQTTKKGETNPTYTLLESIKNGTIGSVMEHGKENAGKVRIDGSIRLNEYYPQNNPDDLVSYKQNNASFIHQAVELNDDVNKRATFDTDILIVGTTRVEGDEEAGTQEKVIVKGYIFDYRGAMMPVEYAAFNPKAMDYFEGLDASPNAPVFTRVQGRQISKTIVRRTEEEGAWGEVLVKETKRSEREFEITWAQSEPYMWDDESTLLASELASKKTERELYLAELKKSTMERTNNNAFAATPTSGTVKSDDYDF